MCGIAGIVTTGEFDPRSLRRMSTALAHRGPDGEGFLISDLGVPLQMTREPAGTPAGRPVVALAHRRLSIIDTSTDNDQPLVDAGGDFAIAFNGEIYNYRELRRELESLGHTFRTRGDTEVALLAYAQWGPDCVERFIGMWALAVCDRSRRTLLLSRDRFGIKPLYWAIDGPGLLFASEIKGLLASGLIAALPDEQTVARYLLAGQVDVDERTFYAGISQLPPATSAIVALDGVAPACGPERYWSLPPAPDASGDAHSPDAAGAVRDAFEESLRLHLRSDVPIGTCLSGGIDSSGIVCVAERLRAEVDPAFTHKAFGYLPPEPEHSERRYMEAVAVQCGAEMTYAQPTAAEFLARLPEIAAGQDEPFGSASIAAQWFVFDAAARGGVKVMLDGQGADEVFGGYHHYLRLIAQEMVLDGRPRELVRFLRAAEEAVGAAPYPDWIALAAVVPAPVKRRAREALHARASARVPVSERLRSIVSDASADPFAGLDADAILRADVERFNLPALLRYEDRNSMAHSIEARVPYLDHRLVELAFALPVSVRMAGAQPKRVLRAALADVLPAVVLERRDKIGFRASPAATWALAGEMRAELLANGDGPAADWLSPVATERLLRKPSNDFDDEVALWRAVNAKLWARQVWG